MKAKQGVKILFGCLLLILLVYVVDYEELWSAFREITLLSLVILFALSGLLVGVSALKWRLFLRALRADGEIPSVLRLSGLYLVGYFFNLLFPSYIGGDAVRSYYVGRQVGQHEAAAATILERYTGLVAMIGLALVMMFFSPLVSGEIRLLVVGLALGVLVLTGAALSERITALCRFLPRSDFLIRNITKVQAGLNLAVKNHRLLLSTFGLSLVFHTLTVLNTLAAGYAVGWVDAPIGDLFVVLPIILLIGAIPLSPQGLGIQEGAFVFFLRGLGASDAEALALALVLRAKGYVLAILGGIIWGLDRRGEQRGSELVEPK